MTEPTGYTALDLVGFTDKGNYNAATAYVKNDLVHYSGDIWRCLVDDTTNITPVEGANWTVFIEAPTNAIEGIIAPIETNPATNSYAVGRQFIYNDKLYEVITAITAGDTLVPYEDDPTNANIQLADPVETQLLDFEEKAYSTDDSAETSLASNDLVPFYDTSAATKKKMTVANMIGQTVSNPNLLDNPWFTVNQRGLSSYSSGYTVDRWASSNLISSVDVSDDGIEINCPQLTGTQSAEVHQYMEDNRIAALDGKMLTLSCIIGSTLYQGSGIYHYDTNEVTINVPIQTGVSLQLRNIPANASTRRFIVRVIFDTSMESALTVGPIRAVKLELGSISTLAMDTAPNYATELAKCQRYFVRYSGNPMFAGICFDTSSVRIPVPINMRATPSVTYTVDGTYPQLISEGSATNLTASNGFTIAANAANQIVMKISSFTGLSANTLCFLKLNTGTLDFSADL